MLLHEVSSGLVRYIAKYEAIQDGNPYKYREYLAKILAILYRYQFLSSVYDMRHILSLLAIAATATAAGCQFMSGELHSRQRSIEDATIADTDFLAQFELNDTDVYMTTDSGTPIDDSVSLKADIRGPTLLEDFIFRQKLQRFDHERVRIFPSFTSMSCSNVKA